MSDQVKHECGIVLIRLLKPLEYYHKKYGTWEYGMHKLYLLMEKQHNRGQDGAGAASLKIDQPAGSQYFSRFRSNKSNPIQKVFNSISESHQMVEGFSKRSTVTLSGQKRIWLLQANFTLDTFATGPLATITSTTFTQ